MYDRDKNLIGFQGRSLTHNSVKYITVMLEDSAPKIYGLDTIDEKLPVYVWSKDPLTALSSTIAWLCVAVMVTWVILKEAIRFLFTITSPAIVKLLEGLNDVSSEIKKSSSGQVTS